MKYILGFIFILLVNTSLGQGPVFPKSEKFLDVIHTISYYWKLDSLANNGYRKEVSMQILFCNEYKSVPYDTVIKYLGKPHSVLGDNRSSILFIEYYYYDYKKMDTATWEGPYGASSITMGFDRSTGKLTYITHGEVEY